MRALNDSVPNNDLLLKHSSIEDKAPEEDKKSKRCSCNIWVPTKFTYIVGYYLNGTQRFTNLTARILFLIVLITNIWYGYFQFAALNTIEGIFTYSNIFSNQLLSQYTLSPSPNGQLPFYF